MAETKSTPFIEIKAESNGRTKTGICAIFGNVDDWNDRLHFGAFTKTLNEGRSRAKHLWNHNFSTPPIASIKELKEIGLSDLPDGVLQFAPNAKGGLLVKRDYYVGNELSEWVFDAINKGDVSEMSFGFDAVKYDYTVENEKEIRELREVKLYDVSDVLWGMNSATIASKSALLLGQDAESYLKQLPLAIAEYQKSLKAGRRNATTDMELIKGIHQAVKDLGFDLCMEKEAEEGNSDAKSAEAAFFDSTSLKAMSLELMALELKSIQ